MGHSSALKRARLEKGMTQAALAAAVGVSRQTINAIEQRGITTRPFASAAPFAGCSATRSTNFSGRRTTLVPKIEALVSNVGP